MQLEGNHVPWVEKGMKQHAVIFEQSVIPDDALARQNALVGIVSSLCSSVVFPAGDCTYSGRSSAGGKGLGVSHTDADHVVNEKHLADDLCVERLSGGITNELFRVYHPCDPTHSVVVRVFGKETDRVISRESEFFYQSFFIPTYVRGGNFLVYQFLNFYEALPFTEMPLEANKIASAIASFQVRATLESKCHYHKPVLSEEERTYWGAVNPMLGSDKETITEMCRFDCEENYTMNALTKWVEQIMSEGVLMKVSVEKRGEFAQVARELEREAPCVRELLRDHASALGESVCHNDLLGANIMRHKRTGTLKIIDFDYVKRNYFLFDIANHFNEYTGLECDYDRYFPTDDEMAEFIRAYRMSVRAELLRHREEAHSRKLDEIIKGQEQFFMYGADNEEEEQRTIAHWVKLVKLLTLASHLSWGIWALLQEAVSALEVDFLEYGKCRLKRYLETKEMFSAGIL